MSSDNEWLSPGIELSTVDFGRLIVGGLVGLSGLLLLAEPIVDPVAVGSMRVPMFGLAAVTLATGLDIGAVVFYRRDRWTIAMAHGVAGLGWTFLAAAPLLGSETLLLVGLLVVVGGMLFLGAETRK